jgi:DNA-directed RNA polymerase subunit RPC12/RpoP
MKKYKCRDCKKEFSHDIQGPGRPPVRCPECRELNAKTHKTVEVRVKLNSTEIVDRLEANLKASGLHISQHRKDWE